jgi:hypothetical protein
VSESRPSEDGPKCLDEYSHQCGKSPEKARAKAGGKGKPGGDQERYLWNSPDTATGPTAELQWSVIKEGFCLVAEEIIFKWWQRPDRCLVKKGRRQGDVVGSTSKEAAQES